MMTKYLALLICFLAFNAYGACSSHERKQVKSIRKIALQKTELQSSLYYRADHYVILLDPKILSKRLEEQAVDGTLSDGQLLKDIRAIQPFVKHVDIFSFVLKNPMYLMRVELLVANMLDRGEASLVDVYQLRGESGWLLTEIERFEFEQGAFSARQFCTLSGDPLIKITDSID